jgi:hypothetical protein
VKEVFRLGGDVSALVPPVVVQRLRGHAEGRSRVPARRGRRRV